MKINIREITKAEYPMLEEFIYTAIYVPPGEELPAREVIFDPEIYIYVDGFGSKPGDCGVVAEADDRIVGAAWTRIIPAYGHLDENTPKLAISVLPGFRGQKIGMQMMTQLFSLLRKCGYKRTSLSVQKDNPAARFYQRLGYVVTSEKLDHSVHLPTANAPCRAAGIFPLPVDREDYIVVKDLSHCE